MSEKSEKSEVKGLLTGSDQIQRCWWCGEEDELYRHYHDHEWGYPVTDDIRLFEKICLEGFQSGLSWITILRKREGFRNGFAGFDFHKVAQFDDSDVQRLLQDESIVRHKGKINATINNAARAIELEQEFGSLAAYFWRYEPSADERPDVCDYEALRQLGQTPASVQLSKDLKKRGWKFVGPVTCYAFMQAMGLVNDHLEGCETRQRCLDARAQARIPV